MKETVGDRIERLARERGLPTGGALADALEVSYETLRKWKVGSTAPNRGRVELISKYLKVPEALVMHGEDREDSSRPAHAVSLEKHTVTPRVEWSELMGDQDLPDLFEVEVPDNAMGPRAGSGRIVKFDRRVKAQPGDGVLVKDRGGRVFFRMYREGIGGHWQAVPRTEGYRTLDSRDDALEIVAVMVGVSVRGTEGFW